MGEPPKDESGAPTYAVQMTDEEWEEQKALMSEYIPAITRDKERADELLRKIIFPSYILKGNSMVRTLSSRKDTTRWMRTWCMAPAGWMWMTAAHCMCLRGTEP